MPTTISSAGEVVVPMSSILDALEGVLSESERQMLFTQLINLSPGGVAPGDLITAELFNNIMSDVNELMVRVAALEGNSSLRAPVINRVEPFSVTAGTEMAVIGENLTPAFLTRIEIGDVRIANSRLKPGSGSTRLIFNAPTMIGLPPEGSPVTVEVANAAGEATAAFVLRPGESENLQANITYRLLSITPNQNIARSTSYDIAFEVDIASSHAETFTLVPSVAVTPATGWSVSVVGNNQVTVPLSAGAPVTRTFTVRLQTGNNDATGQLVVRLNSNRFAGFFRERGFPVAVGSPVVPTTGPIQLGSVSVLGDGSAVRVLGGNLSITTAAATAGNIPVRARIPVTISMAGSYAVSAVISPANPDWEITAAASPTSFPNITAGQALPNIAISIMPKVSAPSPAQLVVNVTGAGALPDAQFNIGLRSVANFN